MVIVNGGVAATANYRSGLQTAYTQSPSFTAGAAPSGATNHYSFYTQIGNAVVWSVKLNYATTGTTITNVEMPFPTSFPTPVIPPGLTGANARVWECDNLRMLASPTGNVTNAGGFFIIRNNADTGFDIKSTGTFTSGSYRTFFISGTYFTA
jgi:hypothetical protein